uniref:transposase n=1 Tax=Neorhodopirellula lusitana TaxID=445327 RepID=UPI00384D3F56
MHSTIVSTNSLTKSNSTKSWKRLSSHTYEKSGRKGIAPGTYFPIIFIGYFEDISSQRGIAWRCADSRSFAKFLGFGPDETTPEHSTLSLTRERLPMEVHRFAFELILQATAENGLLKGETLGVDATDLVLRSVPCTHFRLPSTNESAPC